MNTNFSRFIRIFASLAFAAELAMFLIKPTVVGALAMGIGLFMVSLACMDWK